MKNYFKNNSGFQIKDTILVKIINNGTKEWEQYKGSFKCVEEKSNLFFDEISIPEEVYPESELDLVSTFPRIEKNKIKGNCFTTIKLVYKNEDYNEITINFKKDFDLFGNKFVEEEHVEEENNNFDNEKKDENNNEKDVNNFFNNQKEEENDESIIIKKFRIVFQFSKNDFSDEYISNLLKQCNNDFQKAMMLHIEIEDQKKEDAKSKVNNENELKEMVKKFRKDFFLAPEDYSDEVIKNALIKKKGNFENAFEELMSFIQ
jgi:hypothetical protein